MGNKLQDKARKLAELPYTVKVEKDKTIDGQEVFLASHPELIGCMAQGASFEEAVENLREVRLEYISSLLEDDSPIPSPTTRQTSTSQEAVTVIETFTATPSKPFLGVLGEVVQPSTREAVATVELITG